MADNPIPDDDAADVLRRADALLHKHRRAPAESAPAAAGADIPTLTDVVIEGEVLPRAASAEFKATMTRVGWTIVAPLALTPSRVMPVCC